MGFLKNMFSGSVGDKEPSPARNPTTSNYALREAIGRALSPEDTIILFGDKYTDEEQVLRTKSKLVRTFTAKSR